MLEFAGKILRSICKFPEVYRFISVCCTDRASISFSVFESSGITGSSSISLRYFISLSLGRPRSAGNSVSIR